MKDIREFHLAEYECMPEFIGSAPSVLKLLGEQTAYAGSLVLAMASSFGMQVALSTRKDNSLRFFSASLDERKRSSMTSLKYKKEDRWANYVKAMLEIFLPPSYLQTGLNVTILSNIPTGLGLASSTALFLASAVAIKAYTGQLVTQEENPLLLPTKEAQSIVKLIMEQKYEFWDVVENRTNLLTAGLTKPGSISIVDLKNTTRRSLPHIDGDYVLIITDSKVPRFSIESELVLRREDAFQCLEMIAEGKKKTFRDFKSSQINAALGSVNELKRRRILHVIEENERVLKAEDALAQGRNADFGVLINESHMSLRNLYEISCPELDWLVKRALEINGTLCARLIGQGFGGATAAIMKRDAVAEYRTKLEDYERIFGFNASIYEAELIGSLSLIPAGNPEPPPAIPENPPPSPVSPPNPEGPVEAVNPVSPENPENPVNPANPATPANPGSTVSE